MAGAKLRGIARRVKRIGESQKTIRQSRLLGCKHGGLASAIRLTAQENATRSKLPNHVDCTAQSCLVFSPASSWWPMRTRLPKRQIAPEHAQASFSKCLGQSHQERRITVATGSVGKNESIA